MRQIGHLPTETVARTFGDFLYAQGIDNQIENDPPQGWMIWVAEEDRLAEAGQKLAEFRASPDDPRYKAKAAQAAPLRAKKEKEVIAWTRKQMGGRQLFRPLTAYGLGPLTLALIAISTGVFFLSNFGDSPQRIAKLYISWFMNSNLVEVRHGELWRLITPIFIHMGFMHIFFNLWWLWDLGSMIEARQSTWTLLALVVVIAITSNLGQYAMRGPAFGGMSGVVYGLLAYIWIRGRLDPASGLFVHPTTVMLMLIWFFLCLFGIVANVANFVHAIGLLVGLAWGWVSSLLRR